MNDQESRGVTGKTLYEAEFDPKITKHGPVVAMLWAVVTVVGIPFIPFVFLFGLWYYPEFLRRMSARLTTHAVEIRKGVFFRKESTIPLDRITDVRLYDDPVMRFYGLGGVKLETAGQSGQYASSEGNLVGVIGAADFRDRILRQRQRVVDGEEAPAVAPATAAAAAPEVLTEIRDILSRIEAQGRR